MQQYRKNLGKVSLTAEGAWDGSKAFDILSIVYDEHTQHGFISRQPVPEGVDLYNKEYWMPFNVSGYADNNVIILSKKTAEHAIQSYTLEEAIASIKSVGRRPGAIIGFYNENADRLDIGGRWELWQFNDTNVYNWDNVDSWQNLYYNYNKFMGWFKDENFLNKYAPFPEIGCYAFVGSEFNEATVYRCDNKYVWSNTTQHAWDYVKVVVDGNVTVGENGNWFNNGEDTGIPASVKGENGKTPVFREKDNIIQYSFDNVNWITISDKVAAWFRWNATTGDTQANNVGRVQISRDNITWTNLSGDIINNLHISRYIGADESLPTSDIAEGAIYAKGPYYAEDDALNNNPIYRLWVYAWKGNTLAWQDNGEFTSIAAGVVQETGDSETEVMSQAAVTRELSKLDSKYEKDYEPILIVTDAAKGYKVYDLSLLEGNVYVITNKSSATLSLSNVNPSNHDESYDSFGNCVANMQKELVPTTNGKLAVYANDINSFEVECLNSLYYKFMQSLTKINANTEGIKKCLREGVNVTSESVLSDANMAEINKIYLLSNKVANTPADYGVLYSISQGSQEYVVQYLLTPNSTLYYRVKWREWKPWYKCSTIDIVLPTFFVHTETGEFIGELNEGKNAQVGGSTVYVATGTIGNHSCLIADVKGGDTLKVYCTWTGDESYGCGWIATDANGRIVDKFYGDGNGSGYLYAIMPDDASKIYVNGLKGLVPTAEKTTATKHLDCYTREEVDSLLQNSAGSDISLTMFRKFGVVGDSYASGEIYWKEGSEWKSKDKYSISWGQILARKHGNKCTNYSQGGLNTRTWLYSSTVNGLTKMLNSEAEDLYLLALGINDYYGLGENYLGTIEDITNYSSYSDYADTFYGNYGRIIEYIKGHAPYCKIIIFTCASESEIAQKYNTAIINIANHYNIPYIVQREDRFFSSDIYNDMVQGHPRGVAYCGMANAFDRLINDCLRNNYVYFKDLYMNSGD